MTVDCKGFILGAKLSAVGGVQAARPVSSEFLLESSVNLREADGIWQWGLIRRRYHERRDHESRATDMGWVDIIVNTLEAMLPGKIDLGPFKVKHFPAD